MKMKKTSITQDSRKNIQMWIRDLGSPDGSKRLKTRSLLVGEGKHAVPGLIQALSNGNRHARWEAAKILALTIDPTAGSALVHALEDEDIGVRWAAMEALIALDRACLEPLVQALMKDVGSVWLLEGARHVLHVLKNRGRLKKPMMKVFEALQDVEAELTAPRAAEEAWESLFGPKGKDSFK